MSWINRRRHVPAALPSIVAVLMTALVAVSPSLTVPAHAEPSSESTAKITAEGIAPRVLTPGTDLALTIKVQAPKDSAVTDADIKVRIQRPMISTRSGLQAWINRTIDEDAGTAIATKPIPDLSPGTTSTISIVIPAADIGLPGSATQSGPRGLGIELRSLGARVAIERSFLPWNTLETADTPKASLAVLTPLIAPQADPSTGVATASALGPLTANLAQEKGPLSDIIDHLDGPQFTWAIDPALLASADMGGTTSQEWLSRFVDQAQGKPVMELPYSDPDLNAIAHANRQELAVAAIALRENASAHLEKINVIPGLAFPVAGATDQLTANLASRLEATSIVVSGELLAPAQESKFTPTGRATVQTATGSLEAAISDTTLDSILSSMNSDNASASTQWLLAETAVIALERPSDPRAIMASIPRAWNPGSSAFEILATALESSPWITPISVPEYLAMPAPDIDRTTLAEKQIDGAEATPKELSTAVETRDSLSVFGQIAKDPQRIIGPLSKGWVTLASTSWHHNIAERSDAIAAQIEASHGLINSVYIVLGSSITVVSDSSNIPVVVHNNLDQEVSVSVKMWSWPSLMVSEGSALEVIPANSERTVQVPIEVITSGDVTITAVLSTADGTRFSDEQIVKARMHVNWETIGTIIIAGGLLALMMVGIFRVVRRGRRRDGTTRADV